MIPSKFNQQQNFVHNIRVQTPPLPIPPGSQRQRTSGPVVYVLSPRPISQSNGCESFHLLNLSCDASPSHPLPIADRGVADGPVGSRKKKHQFWEPIFGRWKENTHPFFFGGSLEKRGVGWFFVVWPRCFFHFFFERCFFCRENSEERLGRIELSSYCFPEKSLSLWLGMKMIVDSRILSSTRLSIHCAYLPSHSPWIKHIHTICIPFFDDFRNFLSGDFRGIVDPENKPKTIMENHCLGKTRRYKKRIN